MLSCLRRFAVTEIICTNALYYIVYQKETIILLKKITAAVLAVMMCASLAACGNVDTGSEGGRSGAEPEETTAAQTEAPAESAVADETESTEDQKPAGEGGTVSLDAVDMNNTYIENHANNRREVTAEEMMPFIRSVLDQYSAAQEKDSERFIDLMGYKELSGDIAAMLKKGQGELYVDDEDYSVKEGMLYYLGIMLALSVEDVADLDLEAMAVNSDEENKKALDDALSKLSAEKMNFGIYNEDLTPLSEFDSSTIIGMDIEVLDEEGDDIMLRFDMSVLNGKDEFDMDGVVAWRIDGKTGCIIESAERVDNEFEGMTIDEIVNL